MTTFTPTKFDSVEQKQKFAKQFIKFVKNGCHAHDFPKWFYQRLSMTRGHIAHHDQAGFFDTWFYSTESKMNFINHWIDNPIYGDPEYTYSDVERFLQSWLKQNLNNLHF